MSKTSDEYLNINQKAQLRFSELKRQMKLDLGMPYIEQAITEGTGAKVKVDRQKIEDLLNDKINAIPELEPYKKTLDNKDLPAYGELEKINNKVEDIFEFIDSLELDPKLSLAIGLIISYKTTRSKEELRKAVEALEREING